MRQLNTVAGRERRTPLVDVGVPVLVTAFLAYSSSNEITEAQTGLALVLCWAPWQAYRDWLRSDRKNFPLFALVAAMFWLAYAVPLFWAKHVVTGVFGARVLSEGAISDSMYLAVLGLVCLWVGIKASRCIAWVPRIKADVSNDQNRLNYLRAIFVVGTLVRVFVPITAWGEGGRQIISNFENTVPVVSFAIFIRYFLQGRLPGIDKLLIGGYAVVALIVGLSSGWLGSFVGLGLVCIVIYVYERRKFPVMAAVAVLPLVLFFQPAKSTFRDRYWKGESRDSSAQRASFWVQSSWRLWSEAFTNDDSEQIRKLSNSTVSRFDLLRQTAHVIELTPSRVPYQYGSLYSYIGITFIPRFVWAHKPSVNDANRWYQVTYGLTEPGRLSVVSIAVGTVAESYINFGWLGPFLVIFPLGFFLGTFERIFLRADSGLLFSCLGAVLVPQLLAIEAQMAEYVAGMVQQIGLVLLVLVPTLESQAGKKQFQHPPGLYPVNLGKPKSNPSISRPSIERRESLGK
jgi:hypothetical protein